MRTYSPVYAPHVGCLWFFVTQVYDMVAALPKPTKPFTQEQQHQCDRMGTQYPILPIDGKASLRLFNQLAARGLADDKREIEMCQEWCNYVDGIEIFPTAPSYLRQHVKKWQRSNDVRDQLRKAKSKIEEMRAVNSATLNTFLSARSSPVVEGTELHPLNAAARGAFAVGERSSLAEVTPPGARRGLSLIHI